MENIEDYIYCNYCKRETRHALRGEYSFTEKYLSREGRREVIYRLWSCGGCEHGTMERVFQIETPPEREQRIFDHVYYPERTEGKKEAPWFEHVPVKLLNIYYETLKAYDANCFFLASAGVRALMEGICNDKLIEGGNLQHKIDNLAVILPENIVSNLHSIRFIGNMALHDLEPAPPDQLALAIQVEIHLLTFLYELEPKTKTLAKSRKQP